MDVTYKPPETNMGGWRQALEQPQDSENGSGAFALKPIATEVLGKSKTDGDWRRAMIP